MKMKRIFKSIRGKHKGQGTGGTEDLTLNGRQASLDDAAMPAELEEEDMEQESIKYFDDEDANSLYTDTSKRISQNQKAYGEVESYFSTSDASNDANSAKQATVNTNDSNTTGSPRPPVPPRVTTTTVRVPPPPPVPSMLNSSPSSSPQRITTGGAQQQQSPPDSSRCAETRNLVKKFIADIWNRGDIDMIPSVCSPSLRFNGNAGFDRVGHDGLARMVATIRGALDDYHCEIHSMVVEDNKAFCRLRFTGKHIGSLLGYEPTQKTVAWMGATEFTCQNGKILKVWELGDVSSLEKQLKGEN